MPLDPKKRVVFNRFKSPKSMASITPKNEKTCGFPWWDIITQDTQKKKSIFSAGKKNDYAI